MTRITAYEPQKLFYRAYAIIIVFLQGALITVIHRGNPSGYERKTKQIRVDESPPLAHTYERAKKSFPRIAPRL